VAEAGRKESHDRKEISNVACGDSFFSFVVVSYKITYLLDALPSIALVAGKEKDW